MLAHVSTILRQMPIEVQQDNELDIAWDRLNTFIVENGGVLYKTGENTSKIEKDISLFVELASGRYCGSWLLNSTYHALLLVGHFDFIQQITKFKDPEFLISIHTRDDKDE
jgi:hypothetical protein